MDGNFVQFWKNERFWWFFQLTSEKLAPNAEILRKFWNIWDIFVKFCENFSKIWRSFIKVRKEIFELILEAKLGNFESILEKNLEEL